MKLNLTTTLGFLLITSMFFAQNLPVMTGKSFELKINSNAGNNGLGVAYDASKKLYYTVYAGNASFALEVHDASGISIATKEAGADARGFWYDKKCKCLQGTTHGNAGSYEVKLGENGIPLGTTTNSVSYNLSGQGMTAADKKYIYNVSDDGILRIFKKGQPLAKQVSIKANYADFANLNINGLIYTGIKKNEIGLLNYRTNRLELFNKKTGKLTNSVSLNLGNEGQAPSNFRVAYANGYLFLYQSDTRSWSGYKIQ